jgi:nitrous oxidase accessory protein NosD
MYALHSIQLCLYLLLNASVAVRVFNAQQLGGVQTAIDTAQRAGAGTVLLPANYAAVVDRGLSITGPGITLRCESGASIAKGGNFDLLTVTALRTIVDGCIFDGSAAAGYRGENITVHDTSDFTLRNSVSRNSASTGLLLVRVEGFTITGNRIYGNAADPIFGEMDDKDGSIQDNVLDASAATVAATHAIGFHSTSPGKIVSDIRIANNRIVAGSVFCVEVGAFGGLPPRGIIVSGNQCTQAATLNGEIAGGYSFDNVLGPIVTANTYDASNRKILIAGIELVRGSGAVVTGNTLINGGVSLDKQSHSVVVDNLVDGFPLVGIYVGATGGASLTGNLIARNRIRFRAGGRDQMGIWMQCNTLNADCSQNTFVENTIIGAGAGSIGIRMERDLDSNTTSERIVSNVIEGVQSCFESFAGPIYTENTCATLTKPN